MPAAWQIEDWKRERASLVHELEMLESGKMGTGDKVLRGTTAESIKRVKATIANLDAMIEGRSP